MDFKPENFFIGITEFFSVLLPGALLTWFFINKIQDVRFLNELKNSLPQNDAVKAAAFFLVSYIAGHLIYVFASLLDKWLYSPLRNIIFQRNNDYAFKTASQIKKENYVNDRGLLEDIFKAEKLKKNKKVFEDTDEFKDMQEVLNTYKWGLHYLSVKYPQLINDVKRLEADSKFFRSLVISFLIIAIYYFTQYSGKMGLLMLAIAALSFYRYGDLRYKSTSLVYELIVTIQHLN